MYPYIATPCRLATRPRASLHTDPLQACNEPPCKPASRLCASLHADPLQACNETLMRAPRRFAIPPEVRRLLTAPVATSVTELMALLLDAVETLHATSLHIQCDWTAWRRGTPRLYKYNVIRRGRDGVRTVSTNINLLTRKRQNLLLIFKILPVNCSFYRRSTSCGNESQACSDCQTINTIKSYPKILLFPKPVHHHVLHWFVVFE